MLDNPISIRGGADKPPLRVKNKEIRKKRRKA